MQGNLSSRFLVLIFIMLCSFRAFSIELEKYKLEKVDISEKISLIFQLKAKNNYLKKLSKRDVGLYLSLKPDFEVNGLYEQPFYTVFLDRSASMKVTLNKVKEFLASFHDILPKGKIKLILFNGKHESDEFVSTDDFLPELSKLKPKGSTKIWDLLYKECIAQSNIIRPKYFILLSDGLDQVLAGSPRPYSHRTTDEIIPTMNINNTHIISISFGESANSLELSKISLQTGGEYISSPDKKKMTDYLQSHLHYFYRFNFTDYFRMLTGTDTRALDITSEYNIKYKSACSKEIKIGENKKYTLADDDEKRFILNITRVDTTDKKMIGSYIQARRKKKPLKDLKKEDFDLYLSSGINNFFIDNITIVPNVDVLIDNSGSMKNEKNNIDKVIAKINGDNFAKYNFFVLSKKYPFYKKISEDKLNDIEYSGPTPLYDSMFNIVSNGIGSERRRFIVITDGWDENIEGSHDRMSKKRAIQVLNLMWQANDKLFSVGFGKIINTRTLMLLSENTEGVFFDKKYDDLIKKVIGDDVYRYRIEFSNPVWKTGVQANLFLTIFNSRFLFKYLGEKWDFHPLQ